MAWYKTSSDDAPDVADRARYPLLSNLVSGYFHQDYDILGDDPDEIIRVYKGRELVANQRALMADIVRFLKEHASEDDAELTQTLRTMFKPEVDFAKLKDRSTRESLLKIVDILSDDAIAGRPAP